MDNSIDRVVPLDDLDDFRVAEGDPDVRGWKVISSDGRKIGEVDTLLVDTGAMKVRYLDVDIDDDLIAGDRHVLIPIGFARLDEDSDQIFVDALNSAGIEQLPEYRRGTVSGEFETSLRGHFGDATPSDTAVTGAGAAAASTGGTTEPDFYGKEIYNDDRLDAPGRDDAEAKRVTRSEEELDIDKRPQYAGEVTVDKHVETRHVDEDVPTRHEEVVVERRPATGMDASPRIDSEEVRIPVTEEELVVEKRAVPKEEIVVRKQDRVENEHVEADLRREQVDIHREGDVDVRTEERDRR